LFQSSDKIDRRLLVWDAESDTVGYFDFALGMTDQQLYETENEGLAARPKTAAAKLALKY
jgi:hypothetical protein